MTLDVGALIRTWDREQKGKRLYRRRPRHFLMPFGGSAHQAVATSGLILTGIALAAGVLAFSS